MAASLDDGRLLDPFGGQADLAAGLVRAIGDPVARFNEDGLRPLRACRFTAQLGFDLDSDTEVAISQSLATVRLVVAERIREELCKLLMSDLPSVGLILMEETGLLELLLPELHRCAALEQREMHCFDVLHHSLATCDASAPTLHLRWAALLHDIGKATTVAVDASGLPTFYNHECDSATQAHEILYRLRFSHADRDRIVHLVRHHMFNYDDSWSEAAVRQFLARVGEDSVPDLLALRRADQIGRCGEPNLPQTLIELERRIAEIQRSGAALSIGDLAVNGALLMTHLNLHSGPAIGILLRELLTNVVANPSLNTPARLLQIARNFYQERLAPPG